jgi:hypothetical protein
MPLVAARANAGAFGLGWSAAGAGEEELGGMVLLTPTSIAHSGTSASIGANGSVEFTACSSLSLNGVFSADYDNYMVAIRCVATSSFEGLNYRLRVSGADNSTASSYVSQRITASSTTISGGRSTNNYGVVIQVDDEQRSGGQWNIYGPYLAQPTAARGVNVNGQTGAAMVDWASTHNQSTSYDGFTFYPASGNFTGLVSVYGLVGT